MAKSVILIFSDYLVTIWAMVFSGLSLIGNSQEPAYWQLSDEDGLPSMTVYETLQDDQGFIWMGTQNGICKYDGNSFKTFTHQDFQGIEILKIRKDAWNRIWFVNLIGQLAYIENDQVKLFPVDSINIGKKIINFQVGETVIWLFYQETNSGKKGLLNYHLYKNKHPIFNKYFYTESITDLPLRGQGDTLSLFVPTNISTIILQHYTPNNWNQNKFLFKRTPHKYIQHHTFDSFLDYTIATITKDKGVNIMAISDDSIIELAFMKAPIKVTNLKVIDNICWVTTTTGIWNFTLTPKLKPASPVKILNNVNANDINKDQEGNHWIATTSQGVKIIPSLSVQLLNTYQSNLPNNQVHRLYYDAYQDRILSGHSNGKIVIHRNNQTPKLLDLKIKGRVLDITQNHRGDFYFVIDNGLAVWDKSLNFKHKEASHAGSKTILEDTQYQIWMGKGHGTYLTNNKLTNTKRLLPFRTYALLEDITGKIWMGTTQGLYTFQDSLTPYLENNIHNKYYVTSMTQTTDSTIWISTKTDGIFAIKNNQTIDHFTTKNGLASNQCKRLFWDSTLMWIGTNNGLNYLNPKTKKIAWINKKDGLPSNEIYDVMVAKDEVWVATPKGLGLFNKDLIHINQTPPPVYLTSMKIGGKEHPLDTSIELQHDQNNLQFDFVGLGYKSKNVITYKYRLEGIDSDWIVTNNTIVRYPAVPHGDYQFNVYAINEDGLESLNTAHISISIRMAWWQKGWLKLIGILAIIGMVIFLLQNHYRKKEEQRKTKDKINELKQQALQAQMNPHFVFNVLGAIQKSLMLNEKEQSILYLANFSKLIRTIFKYSKEKEITLEEEIDFLKQYLNLEQLRFKDKIKVDFIIDSSL